MSSNGDQNSRKAVVSTMAQLTLYLHVKWHHHHHIPAASMQNNQCRLRPEDLLPGQAPGSEVSLPAFTLESASDFYRSKTKQNPSKYVGAIKFLC